MLGPFQKGIELPVEPGDKSVSLGRICTVPSGAAVPVSTSNIANAFRVYEQISSVDVPSELARGSSTSTSPQCAGRGTRRFRPGWKHGWQLISPMTHGGFDLSQSEKIIFIGVEPLGAMRH